MKYDKFTVQTNYYKDDFWNKMMQGINVNNELLQKGEHENHMFVMPYDSNKAYMEKLTEECVFRTIGTNIETTDSDLRIWISDSDEPAEWNPRNSMQTIKENVDVFTKKSVLCHKLAVISRIDMDFIRDKQIDIEDYLVKHFAKRFGKAEENAFVNGTGENMPIGILHESEGAETGVTTESISYDDVIALYFSAKPEYRTNGVWLMNDETAAFLRKLKDKDGNYLWNHSNDTILSKPVYISNYMPSTGKVIAFGDFSYYWIFNRMPLCVRSLTERYTLHDQIGYLAHEYLDAKLTRSEAIKVLELK